MKTLKGLFAAVVLVAALVPCFASQPALADDTVAPAPEPEGNTCNTNQQCYAWCGEYGGRCIFHTCYCI